MPANCEDSFHRYSQNPDEATYLFTENEKRETTKLKSFHRCKYTAPLCLEGSKPSCLSKQNHFKAAILSTRTTFLVCNQL